MGTIKQANHEEIIKSLRENDVQTEMLELDGEQFRLIYRYLERVGSSNYMSGSQLLIFTFTGSESNEPIPAKVIDSFIAVLRKFLRISDVFTKREDNQIMVLLFDINKTNSEMVIERIENEWSHELSDYRKYHLEIHTEWLK
jgi:hypothetical protein